jgi:hypothetical protein
MLRRPKEDTNFMKSLTGDEEALRTHEKGITVFQTSPPGTSVSYIEYSNT